MSIEVNTLSNGFTVVTDHIPHVDTVAVGVWTGVGSRNETAEINGVSHFLEHLAFKGTSRRTARDIALEVENRGGYMNAYTSQDVTAYHMRFMKEDAGLGIDIIGDILLNSAFPEEEVERERGVVLQEIARYDDEPESVCHHAAQAVFWPGQSLGRPILGPASIIETIPRETIAAYLADNYKAERMVLSVAGNIDPAAIVAQAEQVFGGVGRTSDLYVEPARFGGGEKRVERDSEQVHYVMGFGGVSVRDPEHYAQEILAEVLGGGMSSRLFDEIREKRGLVYSIYAWTDPMDDGGSLAVYAGTGRDEIAELVPVLCGELQAIQSNLTAEEVERAKTRMRSRMAMSQEAAMSRATRHANQILSFGELLDPAAVLASINAVTVEQVQALARRMFRQPPAIAAVGKLDKLETYEATAARLA